MTLPELYSMIQGDYEQALRVMRMDKLIDKHIRKLPTNTALSGLMEAAKTMDPTQLFESAHAVKGVCGNLGLVKMAAAAGEITEEFRPGAVRRLSDAELRDRLDAIAALYAQTLDGIKRYTES